MDVIMKDLTPIFVVREPANLHRLYFLNSVHV